MVALIKGSIVVYMRPTLTYITFRLIANDFNAKTLPVFVNCSQMFDFRLYFNLFLVFRFSVTSDRPQRLQKEIQVTLEYFLDKKADSCHDF